MFSVEANVTAQQPGTVLLCNHSAFYETKILLKVLPGCDVGCLMDGVTRQ